MADTTGYIKLHRKLIESKIWIKPPNYIKVWLYILMKANHKENKLFKRGECLINTSELVESCSYFAGYRKISPSKKEIYKILDFLRNPCEDDNEKAMIATTKTTRGVRCKVLKYTDYQQSSENEGDSGSDTKGKRKGKEGDAINKNDIITDNKQQQDISTSTEKNQTEICNKWILSTFYNTCGYELGLKKTPILTDKRKKHIRARIKEDASRNENQFWLEYFAMVQSSDYLMGRVKDWSCSLDWLLNLSNMVKVLEGNYVNKGTKQHQTTADKPTELDENGVPYNALFNPKPKEPEHNGVTIEVEANHIDDEKLPF